jgi:hypothetical protein
MTMNPTVSAALEVQIAELTASGRVAAVPQAPLLWGSDLSCVSDCDASFSELPANSPLIVAQAVTRRFLTPRGGLLDDQDYGLDLRGYCNRGVTQLDLRTLQTRCVAEALKDERVSSCTIDVSTTGANSLSVKARITPADPGFAPFTFVLAVDSETALLELI